MAVGTDGLRTEGIWRGVLILYTSIILETPSEYNEYFSRLPSTPKYVSSSISMNAELLQFLSELQVDRWRLKERKKKSPRKEMTNRGKEKHFPSSFLFVYSSTSSFLPNPPISPRLHLEIDKDPDRIDLSITEPPCLPPWADL